MARSISEIQTAMIADIQADPTLVGLNSPSATAIWRLWTFIFSAAIHFHESFVDLGIEEMEQIARDSVPGTKSWIQRRILEFQYDENNPQVVSVQPDGRVIYQTVNESLRIITRCAVVEQSNGEILIKVAKGDNVLEKLTTEELNALKSYVNEIMFAGIRRRSVSLDADVFVINVDVIFDGQFVQSQVDADIKTALKNYLKGLSTTERFDGLVVREHVVDAIQKVNGVVGIDTQSMTMTGSSASGTPTVIDRTYNPDAGYLTLDEIISTINLTPNGI